MIFQFIEAHLHPQIKVFDIAVIRVNTKEIRDTPCSSGTGQPALAAVSLTSKWITEVAMHDGFVCPSFEWDWVDRTLLALGYSINGKVKFTNDDLRKIGLKGKILADQMSAATYALKSGIEEPKKINRSANEFWKDKFNWRIRETLTGRERRR